jgi:hypothetical protein
MDTRRDDEPAWTTHARRITPGQEIRVNRDDDAEEGDLGMQRQEKSGLEMTREKSTREDGSGGSATAVSKDIEMADRHGSAGEGSGHSEEAEEDGRNTPVLAEYREGNHLIRERKKGEGEEVSSNPTRLTLGHGRGDTKLLSRRQTYRRKNIPPPTSSKTSRSRQTC